MRKRLMGLEFTMRKTDGVGGHYPGKSSGVRVDHEKVAMG